jgi:hypothetical protein
MDPLFDHEKLDVYCVELLSMTPVARHSSAPLVSMRRSPKASPRSTAFASGKEMLARVVAMLTRLINRFDTNNRAS